jgi:hypothetical protein
VPGTDFRIYREWQTSVIADFGAWHLYELLPWESAADDRPYGKLAGKTTGHSKHLSEAPIRK